MSEPVQIGDNDEMEDMEDEESPKPQVLSRPDLLAALQSRNHSEAMKELPNCVKKRIKALKKCQLETTKLEAKFYEEVHQLECKYLVLYTPFYEKRGLIVSGSYEPTEEECDWESDQEKDDELCSELKDKAKIEPPAPDKPAEPKNEDVKGIPDFWLTIFKNVQMLAEMVQEHDEPVLKHLIDIKVLLLEKDPMGFVLEFHFSKNEYFVNSVLTKEYVMKSVPDESDPFSFEGPEIYKCKGCVIEWNKGKNVTVKTIKKKQKHKSRGSVRTVTKTVQNDSFFNFFSPPLVPDDPDTEMDEDTQALLTTDFEIGHYIRESIVPRAVLYFTGEALDEDFEEEEDDDDEDYEDEEEGNEDEDDAEYTPSSKAALPKVPKNGHPNECKQQ
ncbi:nucleosome assembly protein 1-like 1 [Bacillus rossius redtenbacheri]|uniref:nucleosome assembly protein 1-like 1 n=1 Tax=Bacillus rossius redtenbacheri TaxID=93214 RepID=UPI002FDCF971